MATINVFDQNGKESGSVELNAALSEGPIRKGLLYLAINRYLANQRSGTHSTLTHTEVTGSTKKIYRQKGTGNARHGDNRANIFVGGAVAHGPRPRDYSQSMNKKARKQALKSALAMRIKDGAVKVLEQLQLSEVKTKNALKVLDALKAPNALIILDQNNDCVEKSFRNIKNVKTVLETSVNIFDILKYETILVTKDALAKISQRLNG